MQLLDEIISNLSGEGHNLIDALIKTKVLLHKLGRKDLAEWVNLEINGYPDNHKVPEYRILDAQVKGNVSNGAYFYSDHPLPMRHLDEEVRERFERLETIESISVLERLLNKPDKGRISRPIPVEFNGQITKALTGGYHVQQAWCEIGAEQLAQIVVQVRSRLLDFLLELSDKINKDMTDDDVKQIAQMPETASMFNHAIFGDNATILVGNQNQQSVTTHIYRGDWSSLENSLQKVSVAAPDIAELQRAIESDADSKDVQAKRFGSKVKTWIKGMLGKAVDTTWQIEVGIAANLLTDALKKYYGW